MEKHRIMDDVGVQKRRMIVTDNEGRSAWYTELCEGRKPGLGITTLYAVCVTMARVVTIAHR